MTIPQCCLLSMCVQRFLCINQGCFCRDDMNCQFYARHCCPRTLNLISFYRRTSVNDQDMLRPSPRHPGPAQKCSCCCNENELRKTFLLLVCNRIFSQEISLPFHSHVTLLCLIPWYRAIYRLHMVSWSPLNELLTCLGAAGRVVFWTVLF